MGGLTGYIIIKKKRLKFYHGIIQGTDRKYQTKIKQSYFKQSKVANSLAQAYNIFYSSVL